MGREFTPLIRPGGFASAEKFYILSYEGTQSEKIYFAGLRESNYFNKSGKIELIPLKRPQSGSGSGSNPIDVKNLLRSAKEEYNFRSTDEFWLIIDRDHWESIHKIDFNKLAEECAKEKNFFLALSNPCFEFWLLLHLRKLEDFSNEEVTKILENAAISTNKNYIDQVLANAIGDGRGYNKIPNKTVFLPKIYDAIVNAKSIASADEAYPKCCGSDVYKLVEQLVVEKSELALSTNKGGTNKIEQP